MMQPETGMLARGMALGAIAVNVAAFIIMIFIGFSIGETVEVILTTMAISIPIIISMILMFDIVIDILKRGW